MISIFSIIVAITENYSIGKNNDLIYKIEKDLKRFKSLTQNHYIVMGRKTFESLPFILPNREHIVLTQNKKLNYNNPNVKIIHDPYEFINKYKDSNEEIFIIGGSKIYDLFLPYTHKLYLTKIKKVFIGDSYFPIINYNEWVPTNIGPKILDTNLNLYFNFENYIRK